ncbi:MAG: diadenylate cyclase CdaA [Spirochaetales bacterium]|nr:diadenylate cyclase CdaA [Spirochaetales bacterium]
MYIFRDVPWLVTVLAVVDVLFLSFIIYQVYRFLVLTKAAQLLKGLIILGLVYFVSSFLQLKTVLWILNSMATFLVIVIAIVFQPELRKIFTRLAKGEWFHFSVKQNTRIDRVINAAEMLSDSRRGALVVFERKVGIKDVAETGTLLNADISSNLLVTIFKYDSPLHDGAVIIQEGRILAAGCFLPLSEQSNIKKTFGTRHRAAIGISESSDAVVLIVSEETGAISLAYEANLYYDLSIEEIRDILNNLLNSSSSSLEEIREESFEA